MLFQVKVRIEILRSTLKSDREILLKAQRGYVLSYDTPNKNDQEFLKNQKCEENLFVFKDNEAKN